MQKEKVLKLKYLFSQTNVDAFSTNDIVTHRTWNVAREMLVLSGEKIIEFQ